MGRPFSPPFISAPTREGTRRTCGQDPHPADYQALPQVIFSEAERRIRIRVGVSQVPGSARGWVHKAGNDGFIQLVQDADREVLVGGGATSVGPAGGEVLAVLTLAMHAQVPTEERRRMIYAYPTFHRVVERRLA